MTRRKDGATADDAGTGFKIREIKAEDLNKGFLEALGNLSPVGGLTPRKALDILRKTKRNPYHHVLVAVTHDGQVIGTTTLLVEQKFIHGGGLVGHIEDVAVRSDHEGKGVGGSIVRAAVEMAREQDCYKVILDCKPDLVGFYERIGFRKYEEAMRIDLVPRPS
jgi:glucosamine-phosphate N-acetyltransferase